MNDLMESMKTSSGLKLSLRWKNKRADKEEQMDTKTLVDLLQKDAEIMRPEEVERYPDISAPRLPRQERKPMRQRICSPSMQSCEKFWIIASGLNSSWNARRPARKSGN